MRSGAVFAAPLLALACSAGGRDAPASPPGPPHAVLGAWGIDLANLDTTVKPGDDFYRYVNGKWLATAKIPADRTTSGALTDLSILSETRSEDILAGLDSADDSRLTDEARKVRDLYHTFMDTATVEAVGTAPADTIIAALERLATPEDVARAMGAARRATDGPFAMYLDVDDKRPDAYAVNLEQSGLGLPDRDYYLRDDQAIIATRDSYKRYLAAMLGLAGRPDAEKRAAAVFALETAIARAHWPAADRRDADRTYNPMSFSDLQRLAPQFPWAAYFDERHIPLTGPAGERAVIVRERSAFPKLASVFASTPVDVWQDYLIVHFLHREAGNLPRAIADADFDFYGRTLSGQSQQRPRATRGFYLVNTALGEALGKLYVERYFPPESKAKMQALVANLLKAMESEVRGLSWMSPDTKTKALEKLAHFTTKIGYPDRWRDYGALTVVRDSLVTSAINTEEFDWNRQAARLDSAVDRGEWGMTPPTVNAYYTTSLNEIVFPAAILQSPFFDPNADDAVNYGAIGAVIGHEISHGFDDQGSKFDGTGMLRNWWTDADRQEFDKRTSALGDQYSDYEALPGMNVNGSLTMGENIGDLAGVTIAYAAYQLALGGKPAPVLDGFTGDQRFFLSWAQVWRSLVSDATMRSRLLSNPHSPERFRVNGVVRNVDAWYHAFDVQSGDAGYLAPGDRVRLW